MQTAISRRVFMGSALGTIGVLLPMDDFAASLFESDPAVTFFDRRFDRAREAASQLANGRPLEAVDGDPTAFAHWLHSQPKNTPRPRIRGVTAESFVFCVRQLNPHARVWVRRIDRDLFAWAL